MEKWFALKESFDYEDNSPPTEKWTTILTLFSMEAHNGWKTDQMDVKTTFLNGDMKENVFMSYPKGFVVKGQELKVWKFIKTLYDMNQAPQAWYKKLIGHIFKLNFNHFKLDDATLFVKEVGKTVVYIVVYVYDL